MCARLSELHIEKRRTATYAELAKAIARGFYEHRTQSVVVTDKPLVLLALVSKQWKRLERRLRKELANTLDAQKRQGLTREIAWMQTRRFSAKSDSELSEVSKVDVLFATVDNLLQYAPVCKALYVTCEIERKHLYSITAWMPPGSLVVVYALPRQPLRSAQQDKHPNGQQQLQWLVRGEQVKCQIPDH